VAVGGTAAEAVKQSKLSFLFGNNFPTCYEHAYEELVNALRASTVDPLKNGESWAGDVFSTDSSYSYVGSTCEHELYVLAI